MDDTGHSRAEEALEKQNACSDNLKDDEAYTRSAKAKGSRTWNSFRPSSLGAAPGYTAFTCRFFIIALFLALLPVLVRYAQATFLWLAPTRWRRFASVPAAFCKKSSSGDFDH